MACYLYFMAFDNFSETELVRLSYGWVTLLIFGAHGLIATEVNTIMASDEASTVQEALSIRSKNKGRSLLSRLSSLFIWSVFLVQMLSDMRRPFLFALLAAIIWGGGLAFFFEAIFPSL